MASDERQVNWNDSTINITKSTVQLQVIAEPIVETSFSQTPEISYSNETQTVVKRSRRAIVFMFNIPVSIYGYQFGLSRHNFSVRFTTKMSTN